VDYLTHVLGIKTVYHENEIMHSLPNYILTRYNLKAVTLDGTSAVFVYPISELDSVNAIKKHLDRIRTELGATPVLILERLTLRQKEYLLRDRIPFIVDGKQIYIFPSWQFICRKDVTEKNETTKRYCRQHSCYCSTISIRDAARS